jgi:hypothetical protein
MARPQVGIERVRFFVEGRAAALLESSNADVGEPGAEDFAARLGQRE